MANADLNSLFRSTKNRRSTVSPCNSGAIADTSCAHREDADDVMEAKGTIRRHK